MKLRQFTQQYPILSATLIAVLQFGITFLILAAGKQFAPPQAFGKIKLLAFASTVLLPILMVQALGIWREIGLGAGKASPFFLACLLPVAMFASMGVRLPAGGVSGDLLIQLFNAFGEELLFRGVIFVILLRLPLAQAIVINGLLFGSMHLMHGYMDGNWPAAFKWALMSAMAGMMFTAARYRVASLWWLVGLHMVLNLASMYSNVEPVAGAQVNQLVQYATKAVEVVLAVYVMVTAYRQKPVHQIA
ncbi:hypothetical protein GCM10027321_34120 [Massilia terrae]|uniref:CPBP family intramembrane metalloprotease n=1 Tax=Massilia terrae TaxID=1811224 RepID=A0ABT2CVS6_9BURK|nr:CPBP family intramembrane glutamic endopeptidase [Massilia terrae]MCS0658077.1 CPBP family intramembrane metalloprotease [Massilia terrae]